MLDVQDRLIDTIRPYENNPRENDQAVEAVAESIKEFGWQQPLVVDRDGVIVCGHTRWKAAKKLGLDTVPVVVAGLPPEKAKAYRLADNKSAELADWNMELLLQELAGLSEAGYDASAWFEEELAGLAVPATEGETDADAVPETPEEPVSQAGELYRLGRHTLLVGDATDPKHMQRLMDGSQADLLLTDPPYNVSYVGKTKDALEIQNDEMSDPKFREFLVSAFRNAESALKPGATFYIWHADSEGYNFRGACQDVGWKVRQCLIWVKQTLVMGRQDYHWKHEPCLTGWKSGAAHNWYTDRKQTTVLEFDRPSRSTDHPTMKPVSLFEYLMTNSSRPTDIVLDPFAGSGTTVIAAERLGRVACFMELDPRYADVIRRRWSEFVFGEGTDWERHTPAVAQHRSTN